MDEHPRVRTPIEEAVSMCSMAMSATILSLNDPKDKPTSAQGFFDILDMFIKSFVAREPFRFDQETVCNWREALSTISIFWLNADNARHRMRNGIDARTESRRSCAQAWEGEGGL